MVLASWLLLIMFIVFVYLSMWYPGSGVVLYCIISWILPSFLLWLSEVFCLCWVVALKSATHFHLTALLFQFSRLRVQSSSIKRADLLALVGDVYCNYVTFPCGILGQVWYLVVSFPGVCCLSKIEPKCSLKEYFIRPVVGCHINRGNNFCLLVLYN